jgi:hypothetical protein
VIGPGENLRFTNSRMTGSVDLWSGQPRGFVLDRHGPRGGPRDDKGGERETSDGTEISVCSVYSVVSKPGALEARPYIGPWRI